MHFLRRVAIMAQLCGPFVSCDLETDVGPSTALFPGGLSPSRQLSLVPNVKSACADIAKWEIVLAISRFVELDIPFQRRLSIAIPLSRGGSVGSGVGDVRSPHI
jgi:hypothetical protein